MELVSVIIPVYNVQEYLDECLSSMVNQTYQELEIILIDDGSTDGSGQICDLWKEKDSRIQVIHQKNGGLSAARNSALNLCGGDWITFVDSDDVLASNCIEIMHDIAVRTESMLVQVRTNTTLCFNKDEQRKLWAGNSNEFLMTDEYKTMACAKLYRAKLWNEHRFPEGKLHEDDAVVYKLVYEAGKVAYTTEELYGYRQREGSITIHKKYNLKQLDKLQFLKETVDFYREKNEISLYRKAIRNYGYELLEDYGRLKRDYPEEIELLRNIHLEYRRIMPEIIDDQEVKALTKVLLKLSGTFPVLWTKVLRIRN